MADDLCGRGAVWTHFAVRPALDALDEYLTSTEPYEDVHVFLFEHGGRSPGIAAGPEDFVAVVRRHGATPHLDGLDPQKFPHDIGTLSRYDRAFEQLPRARHPWTPLVVDEALTSLKAAGVSVTEGAPRPAA